jgi:gamma-glutamyltranspeptidase/glutathione hydrolase
MRISSLLSISFLLLNFSAAFAQQNDPYHYNMQKQVTCSKGAVVSAHPLASEAGLLMLKKGGNAFDAAIATQLALAVVYPGAGNIGGGGFLVAHLANGKNISLDYREKAPGKASRDMYLDSAGNPMLDNSQYGHLSSGVPGTIAGLFASLKYAKLPFATLIAPAIELAEKGFVITESQANGFNNTKKDFIKYNTSIPAFVKDQEWKTGDTLIQKDLAGTLKRIRDIGQKGFYEGETARLIVEEMEKSNGIISLEDLKNYKAIERKVIDFKYKNFRILTMPLPSSGGIILEQMMKMIEGRNIAAMKFQTPASVQLITEIERRAYADRANFLGDPDFVKVPVKTMVSEKYLRERMLDFVPGKAGNSDSTKAGLIPESMETTHLSITDNEGNAVSVTTTLNGGYGSKTVVAGAGFLLNNEMDDFSVKPGVPNMYGAVGNEKNAIAPNKRMLSSMSPTIVLQNDQPYLVLGTPGGTTIPTSVFQTLVNVLEFNMSPAEAVNQPKFHHQWLPDQIYLEQGFNEHTKNALTKMGYKVTEIPQIGRVELISIQRRRMKGGRQQLFSAVADHRGDDAAAGY